jgi:hypothetical protein
VEQALSMAIRQLEERQRLSRRLAGSAAGGRER